MKYLFILLILIVASYADDLSTLLNSYKHDSGLSKITKKEEAGIIDIYTRQDLEDMQAKTFEDVLRILPGFHMTRTSNNIVSIQKPTTSNVQFTSIRFYVNDHDMSSTSFGSAALIWGELPIEYIDHIEVYKGASSIEFGNETGSIILKLYTKTAQRDNGGKLRILADNYGSSNVDTYLASTLNKFSYFAYANINNIHKKEYTNTYKDQKYNLKSNRSGHNLYANLQYEKWLLELGSYHKESDNFLGLGIHKTPTDGGLNADHHYMHLSKKFNNDIKLQFSYDNLSYSRTYIDPNGIKVANAPIINDYNIKFDDEIFSTTLEKKIKLKKHSFLIGGFYKKKKFKEHAYLSDTMYKYNYNGNSSNAIDMYSLYAEYIYNFNQTTKIIASVKEDIYNYQKDIDSKDELSSKLGFIKYIDDFHIKAFITSNYVPTNMIQLYNPDNIPYKSNPNLDNMHLNIGTCSLNYKKDKHNIKFIIAHNILKNIIMYDPKTLYGYKNSSQTIKYTRYDFKYTYLFDMYNKFAFDIFTGSNSKDLKSSPKYGSILQLFSKYKMFNIYNEITYKNNYEFLGISVNHSINYTASIKYHYSKDLSFGLRAENIFDNSYAQVYKGLNYAIPVTDQKVWFNLEYLF